MSFARADHQRWRVPGGRFEASSRVLVGELYSRVRLANLRPSRRTRQRRVHPRAQLRTPGLNKSRLPRLAYMLRPMAPSTLRARTSDLSAPTFASLRQKRHLVAAPIRTKVAATLPRARRVAERAEIPSRTTPITTREGPLEELAVEEAGVSVMLPLPRAELQLLLRPPLRQVLRLSMLALD